MASLSRPSLPVLLNLSEEDFQRGYVGSRPPSLIAPQPSGILAPLPPQRSGHGKTVALLVAAVALSVVTTQLLHTEPRATTTVGTEVQQSVAKVEQAEKVEVDTSARQPQPSKPMLAVASKPSIQQAMAAPVVPIVQPTAAAPVKPRTATAVIAEAEPEPEPAPAAETPTYGIDEAGF